MSSLLDKTPERPELGISEKKRINSSFDTTLNIFSDEYHMQSAPYVKIKKMVDLGQKSLQGYAVKQSNTALGKNNQINNKNRTSIRSSMPHVKDGYYLNTINSNKSNNFTIPFTDTIR